MPLAFARHAAFLFGAFAIVIETWRRWHQFGEVALWPAIFDDWLMGGFLIGAARFAGRDAVRGRPWLAGAWGVATGIMYGSFFIGLQNRDRGDPSGFPAWCVLAVKGAMLALCLAGLVASLRAREPSR
jgi:hypothetical protein